MNWRAHSYRILLMTIALFGCESDPSHPVVIQWDDVGVHPLDARLEPPIEDSMVVDMTDVPHVSSDMYVEAPPPSVLEGVDEVMEGFLADYPTAEGAAVIILHRDRGILHRKAYGGFDEERIYFVASSSKMVSAGMMNRLHDDGVLDLYRPISEAVEWGQDHPDIMPVHLISNSSGLPGLYSNTATRGHLCQFLVAWELEECAQSILSATPEPGESVVAPDTEFRYGGAQWQVAGGVAEAVTGQTWFQLFDTIYAQPCGLIASGFSHQLLFGASGDYPFGFDGDLERLRPTDNPFIEGGMYTTIDDYGRLLLMHLQGGVCGQTRVHPEETIERMHADRILQAYQGWTGQPSLGGYGMGWWVDRRREGWVSDPGAYGSYPYLDKARGIAVFTVLEMSIREGFELHRRIRPVVERAVDAQAAGAE